MLGGPLDTSHFCGRDLESSSSLFTLREEGQVELWGRRPTDLTQVQPCPLPTHNVNKARFAQRQGNEICNIKLTFSHEKKTIHFKHLVFANPSSAHNHSAPN